MLVGTTGSGKSTLAEFIAKWFPHCFVIDPKALLKWKGFERHTTLEKFCKGKSEWRIYAPVHEELQDEDVIEAWFDYVYRRGETFVYVDEVYGVARGQTMPNHYHAILTRGRERGIGCLSSTQRPTAIPQSILSEAETFFVFRLQLPGDREKIEEVSGISSEEIAALPKRYFLVRNFEKEFPTQRITLQLPKQANLALA